MNIQELDEWLKNAEYINTPDCDHDENGNKYETRVFKKDEQLYRLGYCNNHPNPKWGEKGYMSERDANNNKIKDERGQPKWIYEPTPVKKVTHKKMIEVVEYLPI
ncbi:hypothetical protein D4R86_00300 [bacterium]|nr:MAG: hypothetical protein D4R86_00300 [bacterium]